MTVYIDKDYRCHTEAAQGLRAVETPFFEGKCAAFIEGYRYVPAGETWQREDGELFTGEMTAPAEDLRILEAYQAQHEDMLEAMSEAYQEGVNSI